MSTFSLQVDELQLLLIRVHSKQCQGHYKW